VVHHIEGRRMRIRVPSKRHDRAFFHAVKERLHTVEGIDAKVDPTSASVLVHYSGPVPDLLEKFVDTGLDELLDIELGPLAQVADSVVPLPLKLLLVVGLLAFGWYEASA
jgi:hypothetical protein